MTAVMKEIFSFTKYITGIY